MAGRTFDQLIDFTRTTAGTYVDSTGKIVNTPASRNLLTFTQQFDNAAWSKNNTTVVPNQNPAAATLGGELVTNGDFATDTVWTKGDGWTITGGLAVRSPAAFGSELTQPISLVAGRLYRVEYTISAHSAQSVRLQFNGGTTVLGTLRAANGTYVEYLTAVSGNNTLSFACGAAAASLSIDNVSVREVVGGWNVAPDGTSTADKLEETATTAVHNAGRTITTAAVAYTWSCYVKAAERNFALLYHTQSNSSLAVNLTTGATGTASGTVAPTSSSVVAVGNGWWRVSMTVTATAASNFFGVYVMNDLVNASYAGVAGSGILIWGAQLEQASSATDYTRNVGGVFPPRFDYDPVTLAPRGLLIEEQRVNLLLRSEEFDNASWAKLACSVTANSTAAPDGATVADTLVESATTDTHFLYVAPTLSAGSHTLSLYYKIPSARKIALYHSVTNTGRQFDASGNQSAGLFATPSGGATVAAVGNGWYRATITVTATAGANEFRLWMVRGSDDAINYAGDGTSGIFIYGAQLEAGAFATSYIPTVASQVTRAADVAAITGPNFTPWYNQSAGTFVVSVDSYAEQAGVNAYNILSANDGTTNNYIRNYIYATNAGETVRTAASTVADVARGTWSQNVPFNLAATYAANDFIVALNGTLSSADTSGAVPTANQLALGANNGVGSYLNGHIRSIRYYPSRLSNAQIQALTA